MWKLAVLCLSLANLQFLGTWKKLLGLQAENPLSFASDPVRTFFIGTIICVFGAGAALWLIATAGKRLGGRATQVAGQCALMVLLIAPLDQLGYELYLLGGDHFSEPLLKTFWTAMMMIPVFGCLLLLARENDLGYRLSRGAAMILAPLTPIIALNLAWGLWSGTIEEIRLAEPLPGTPERRVVWVVFDELDQRLAFEARPDTIELPELDRLRSQSFYAANALPPAMDTPESLSSLITGRMVNEVRYEYRDIIGELDGGEEIAVSQSPTIFTGVRDSGGNSSLTGWHLPYCRTLGHTLTACAQPFSVAIRPGSVLGNVKQQLADQVSEHWLVTRFTEAGQHRVPWWGYDSRKAQLAGYLLIHKRAIESAADPSFSLVFAHYPVPHPHGIYNRKDDDFGLDIANNYVDNLELTDRTVGELRQALTDAGLDKNTTLLVSSDHPFRPEHWKESPSWSDEEEFVTGGKNGLRIPFLLKLATSDDGIEYDAEFNTLFSSDLLTAILDGSLTDPSDIGAWLDERLARRDSLTD